MTHLRLTIEDNKKVLRRVVTEAKTAKDCDIIEKEVSMLKSLFRAEESEK